MAFLRQARRDARLFDADYYLIALDKLRASMQAWLSRLRHF
jgi:hypothetical protein